MTPHTLHMLLTRRERLLEAEKRALESADRKANWHEVDERGVPVGAEVQLTLATIREGIAMADAQLRSIRSGGL